MSAKFLSSVFLSLIILVSATVASAQNVLLFTFDESGPNVTATVTGSFDTSGLTPIGQSAPRLPSADLGAIQAFLTFGTTTATNVDKFTGASAPGLPVDPIPGLFGPPLLYGFPNNFQDGGTIVTPLSEYLEINVFGDVAYTDLPINTTFGLAEGETIFNADTLANNVIVFQQSSLDDLGNSSFLSSVPTTVLTDPSGDNTIQFVLATEIILGDVNRDGVVDFFDISPFLDALAAVSPFIPEADTDQSLTVDFFDIAPFIAILFER